MPLHLCRLFENDEVTYYSGELINVLLKYNEESKVDIIADSRQSGQYTPETPLSMEFKSPKGVVTFHSRVEVSSTALVVLSNSGKPEQLYATDMDSRDAADLLKKALKINKQQLIVGRAHMVTPIADTNCVNVVIALPGGEGQEDYMVSFMCVDPYHPREVKPIKESVGPRSTDTGATLVVVDDLQASA